MRRITLLPVLALALFAAPLAAQDASPAPDAPRPDPRLARALAQEFWDAFDVGDVAIALVDMDGIVALAARERRRDPRAARGRSDVALAEGAILRRRAALLRATGLRRLHHEVVALALEDSATAHAIVALEEPATRRTPEVGVVVLTLVFHGRGWHVLPGGIFAEPRRDAWAFDPVPWRADAGR